MGTWNLEIIRRSDKAKRFEVLPRRWVALRTLAWLFIANIRLMTRRIARG